MSDRDELRTTFDRAAATYHTARPRYPPQLFDALVRWSGVAPGDRVLEVGPGTGIATEELARRGFDVVALELGPELAAAARANVVDRPSLEVVTGSFETWQPPVWGAFDLVCAATAWHWIAPDTRYELAHRHLRPGGSLAFWAAEHVVPDGGDPFFAEIQPVYDEIGESLPKDSTFVRPGEQADLADEIADSGWFDVVAVEHFDWETTYDADGYVALLETFSGHIAMAPWKRDRLFGEIRRRLADRVDGRLRRHWGAVLHVAQMRSSAPG